MTQPIEAGHVRSTASSKAGVAGSIERSRAAVLGEQQIALGSRLAELLIELADFWADFFNGVFPSLRYTFYVG